MPKLRIALVSYDVNEGRASMYPPLHLCTLATNLQAAGYEVRVFDYKAPFASMDGFFREIDEYGPGLIGLSCFTPYIQLFHRVTTALRKAVRGGAMVVGGYHSTIWPEWCLQKLPQFDYAMQGECDRAVVQLAEFVEGTRRAEEVAGLVYRTPDGGIRKNDCDHVPDLNVLPQTDRSFLDRYYQSGMYSYVTESRNLDMMITSRGCPYTCSFCFKVERKYRFRSVEHVMTEFEILRRRGVRTIHIQDDAFTAHKKRCLDIADELIRGKYGFRLKVRSRVNSVDEAVLRRLRACGVRQIVYGLESGSQAVLDCMDKHATVEMNERAIRLTNRAGIFCTGDIMVGMPAETPETIQQTIAFLKRNRVIISSVPFLYPLPGTRVYDDAKASGTLRGDWDLTGPDPWVKLPWTNSIEDLRAASLRIEKVVHRDPRSMLYMLRHNPQVLTPANFRLAFREMWRAVRG
jgi:radical SAM superfamily enzyme YgiQ (UPF0313 family)